MAHGCTFKKRHAFKLATCPKPTQSPSASYLAKWPQASRSQSGQVQLHCCSPHVTLHRASSTTHSPQACFETHNFRSEMHDFKSETLPHIANSGRLTDTDGSAAVHTNSVIVMQWSQEVQLQEVQVPQAVLRLLCSRNLLSELQLQLLHEHRGKQVSTRIQAGTSPYKTALTLLIRFDCHVFATHATGTPACQAMQARL